MAPGGFPFRPPLPLPRSTPTISPAHPHPARSHYSPHSDVCAVSLQFAVKPRSDTFSLFRRLSFSLFYILVAIANSVVSFCLSLFAATFYLSRTNSISAVADPSVFLSLSLFGRSSIFIDTTVGFSPFRSTRLFSMHCKPHIMPVRCVLFYSSARTPSPVIRLFLSAFLSLSMRVCFSLSLSFTIQSAPLCTLSRSRGQRRKFYIDRVAHCVAFVFVYVCVCMCISDNGGRYFLLAPSVTSQSARRRCTVPDEVADVVLSSLRFSLFSSPSLPENRAGNRGRD